MSDVYNKKEITLEYFKNLIAIANADGQLDENEKLFLQDKAKEFGLPSAEVDVIIENANLLQFKAPEDSIHKEEHLADIVFMSMIDGELHDTEYQLCLSIAEKLDMKKKDVDHVVKMIKKMYES